MERVTTDSAPQMSRLLQGPKMGVGEGELGKCGVADPSLSSSSCMRTDSGFLSGANLLLSSEGCSETELKPSSPTSLNPICPLQPRKKDENLMRLDSGVDVGGILSLGSLSLNDLNCPSSSSSTRGAPHTPTQTSSLHRLNCSSEGYVSPATTGPTSPTTPILTSPLQTLPASSATGSTASGLQSTTIQWESFFVPDDEGDTYLHIAIMQGFIEVVFSLVSMVPDPAPLDTTNDLCQSPLHLAVLTGQARIVRRLVVAGARLDVRDHQGNTPLHLAALIGHLDCLHALTLAVALPELHLANLQYLCYPPRLPTGLDDRNFDGQMSVHLAATRGHVEILRRLSWLQADINAREGKSGRTPLHLAAERGNVSVGRVLLECGAEPNAQTYAGYTPYQLACCTNAELAHLLALSGAFPLPLPESDLEFDSDDSSEEMTQDFVLLKDMHLGAKAINIAA